MSWSVDIDKTTVCWLQSVIYHAKTDNFPTWISFGRGETMRDTMSLPINIKSVGYTITVLSKDIPADYQTQNF